ncbi:NAD(P)/FAD-dependent oxidoreductase [Roseovarius spongiae]|uniref:NAD(P)/FAD-dependent oxidoreductase n=1 Tax=Roseovarius spongiae TaxID=2320272 RepID=A0A3A8B4M9_9RHOB|nr:NAD(P)/FAD-dependent oxidoreductase [Roseovarius spongiae]RKF16731.1 NAD(P)/FAD-dependent oxidoreductase [Roseovarius spongiae]
MSGADAIVIGAGINGLTAATVLVRAGRSVCVLEAAAQVGGMANPRIAHFLYNLSPLVRADLGLGRRDWPFATHPLPSVALDPGGRHVVLRGDEARLAGGGTPPEANAWRDMHARLTRYGAVLRQLAEAAPPGLEGGLTSAAGLKQMLRLGWFGIAMKRLGRRDMREFMRVLLSNAYDMILDEMPDGPLAGLLAADAVRGGAVGPRQPGTVLSLIYRMGHGGAVSLPAGGMATVTGAFERAARDAGCRIETGAQVTQIVIEGDAVRGVETADGRRFDAPLVLGSGGAAATCALAGPAHFDIEAQRRLRNIRARGTAAKLNLTLDALPEISGLPADLMGARMVLAPRADYVERAMNAAKYGEISDAPVIEMVIPSLTDATLARNGGHVLSAIVQCAPHDLSGGWNDAARDRLRDRALAALAEVAPGLPDLVTEAEVITPADIEAETGAPGGHWHHGELSLDQILTLRPASGMGRYAIGPNGLFLCGAGAHPGGDVMGLAGRNAARAALGAEGGR